MVEDKPEDSEPLSEMARAKRAPPTIELQASEVSGETKSETRSEIKDPAEQSEAAEKPDRSSPRLQRASISAAVISAVSGACVAALVIAAAWLLGWPGDTAPPAAPPSPAPASSAALDDLAARIAAVESKASKPSPAPDPAMAARLDAVEKSVAALRMQSDQLAVDVKQAKSTPNDSTAAPDIAAINQRIDALERATRAQSAEIAQQKAQDNSKPADDAPLRRLVAASLLDVLVRIGDPYPAALAAAKSLAPDPDVLKPLEAFAASGVPSAAVLSRELLTLVPKLSPPSADNAGTGSSLVDRLQAGAAKLVRIERTDTHGNERGNVVARITAAALRNDYNEARRELNTLPPSERAPAQGWIEKADARDAALAVSRQFAAEAMTALAKPAP
jgi:hypothetical protein